MSSTPIYDELKAEADWAWMSQPFEPVTGSAWVEILPDVTKFRELLRVGGRRSGRSAERAEWFASMQAYTDWVARAMAFPSLSAWVERSDLYPKYSAEVQELSRTTGWSLEEAADMYQRVANWAADAMTEENIKALGRPLMRKDKHYPTSGPYWARRRNR